jgi:hypothetical protein
LKKRVLVGSLVYQKPEIRILFLKYFGVSGIKIDHPNQMFGCLTNMIWSQKN